MDKPTAHKLNELNALFYRAQAASFSQTRQNRWPGWERVLAECGIQQRDHLRVLDVGCGNLRFESFLGLSLPKTSIEVMAVDNCRPLSEENALELPENMQVKFELADVVAAAIEGKSQELFRAGSYDMAVCFGLMHHVPGLAARSDLVEALRSSLARDGMAAVSYWCFLRDDRIAAKAEETTCSGLASLGLSRSQLDEGDFLLGWQNKPGCFRYCHDFSKEDLPFEAFLADGKSNELNSYSLFPPLVP